MDHPDSEVVTRFVLNGRQMELRRSEVEAILDGVTLEHTSTHAVLVGGSWYPVRQAFELACGTPRAAFNTHTARRHLGNLGLEIRGEIQHRGDPSNQDPTDLSWRTEANVQAAVVGALQSRGWTIVSQADTATKEHGIDVLARHDERIVGIEVKGFPSTTYADPRRMGEVKPTQPSTQAVHWYAQAVLAAMRLRSRHPEYASVVAVPDVKRYRSLHAETRQSLQAAEIQVWWVGPSGDVEGIDSV